MPTERNLDPNKVGVAVFCTSCGLQKQPLGRSAPMDTVMCAPNYLDNSGCRHYRDQPYPGTLWPGESERDFGHPVGELGTNKELKSAESQLLYKLGFMRKRSWYPDEDGGYKEDPDGAVPVWYLRDLLEKERVKALVQTT